MLLITIALVIASTFALRYGGNGGRESVIKCARGNYVETIEVRSGSRLDAIRIGCTNQNIHFAEWKGGKGGNFHSFKAAGSGFCGMGGRDASIGFYKLCLTAVSGESRCFGTTNSYSVGNYFHDRACVDYPGDGRARLTGFTVRSGSMIDGLTPHWETDIDCSYYLQIANSGVSSIDGYYSFDGFYKGHHKYKKDNGACIYYSTRAWRIHENCNTDAWNIKIDAKHKYGICPYHLHGHGAWYRQGRGRGFIYPSLQITAHDSLPLVWGNGVGYWVYKASGTGSSAGAEFEWSTSLTDTSSTSQAYSTSEQNSFSATDSFTGTMGFELGHSAGFNFGFASASAETKWSATVSLGRSTTQTTTYATQRALTSALQTSRTTTQKCGSAAPVSGAWALYTWEVYRASNRKNVGGTVTTCEFQYQKGLCSYVPPNCPLGTCVDVHCIQCIAGAEPYMSLSELRRKYPGCLDSLNLRRELSQGDEEDDPHFDLDPLVENQASRQKSRLLEAEKVADLEPKDLDERLDEALNADDDLSEEELEAEHQTVSGCMQFDDEGHCTAGPLYKYCRWTVDQCVTKENIKDADVPEGDFSYVYDSSEPFFMHEQMY